MLAPAAREVVREVAFQERRHLFLDEFRRSVPVERRRAEWIVRTERLWKRRRVELDRLSPPFREEQRREAIPNFVFNPHPVAI